MSEIEIKNVSKQYPGVLALDKVSFQIEKGRVHGFLGPNGAGKSTTMKVITGLIPPSEGDVIIQGTSILESNGKGPGKIGFLPENPPLYPQLKVEEYLEFVAKINKSPISNIQKDMKEVMERCGLTQVKNRLIGNLSKGYKQRVGIAQALVQRPEIIILDEPTIGLDPNALVEIRELILSLKEDHTILFSSHHLDEVKRICDDITFIHRGKIITSGAMNEIHKEFHAGQVIVIDLLNWIDVLWMDMRNIFPGVLKVTPTNEGHRMTFYSQGEGDARAALSRYLVEKECAILRMVEEEIDLETIFDRLTHEMESDNGTDTFIG